MKAGLGLYRHMLTRDYYDFARQAGCTHAVIHLVDYFNQGTANPRHNQPTGGKYQPWGAAGDPEKLWSLAELKKLREEIEDAGLYLAAVENFDPAHWHDILLDGPRRPEQIENVKTIIRRMGEAGIPVMGYNFSLAGVCGRVTTPSGRGRALTVGMDGPADDEPVPNGVVWNMIYDPNAPPGTLPAVSHEELWRRLQRFLEDVIPVAEQAGVRLAAHPDDPPTPTMRGQPRLVFQPDMYQLLLDLVPSRSNALEFCVGTVAEMTGGDVCEAVDRYSGQGKIAYVHLRNIAGKVPHYRETFIDEGDVDMVRILSILKRNGFDGVVVPDHTPQMSCSAPWHAGMAHTLGFILAVKAMLQSNAVGEQMPDLRTQADKPTSSSGSSRIGHWTTLLDRRSPTAGIICGKSYSLLRRHDRTQRSTCDNTVWSRAQATCPCGCPGGSRMNVNLKSLVGKLNGTTRNALEAAAGFCLSRTHYDVELEHFLLKTLEPVDNDILHILRRFEVDRSRLTASLNRILDKFKSGNARTPSLSPHLVNLFTKAWTIGSVDYGATQIRSGFVVVALLSDGELQRFAADLGRDLAGIEPERLRLDFLKIVAGSVENAGLVQGKAEGEITGGKGTGNSPNLDQYTVDLTENARAGKIDSVLGRDVEIRQIVDILMRRRQNNPILTGEAGVGKTAVVEGFALRVANGDVPAPLRTAAVRALDLALLQAGAGIKGEFENRLKGLIEEVKKSPQPIILFIDEAHTMIGAGGQAGQNDAANLLKPALARGELRTVAATTWSEYKKYFEKDPALARRFQVVKVEEPGETQCMVMMRGIVHSLEKHHNVRILDEGLAAAVTLSHRYLAGRQLPDKAVSVLDTACARLALGQNVVPAAIEDLTRRMDDLGVQQRILRREALTGADHGERITRLSQEEASLADAYGELESKWQRVKALVGDIRQVREALEQESDAAPLARSQAANGSFVPSIATGEDGAELRERLASLTVELDTLQGENALTQVCVDEQLVGRVISDWTGIPLGKMIKDEIGIVLALDQHLARRVIGQNQALSLIGQRIQTGRASLEDPGKPVGVFLLVGPSGVGKTETALALSDLLYGGEQNLITINMSEFQEGHTISTLKGSPPGYVGYGEGGVLTEAVRRRPYSVVLLDEIEKAHPDVRELFYQVFDRGTMEDGEGREIDFKNTIIILTTNAGSDRLMELCDDPDSLPGTDELVQTLKPVLNEIFKPAFLGRMVIVPYYPLRDETLKSIVELKLEKIKRRMQESHKIDLRYDADVVSEVTRRCTEVESGARNVDNILTNTLLPDISRKVLTSMALREKLKSVSVGINTDGSFYYS